MVKDVKNKKKPVDSNHGSAWSLASLILMLACCLTNHPHHCILESKSIYNSLVDMFVASLVKIDWVVFSPMKLFPSYGLFDDGQVKRRSSLVERAPWHWYAQPHWDRKNVTAAGPYRLTGLLLSADILIGDRRYAITCLFTASTWYLSILLIALVYTDL